MSKVYAYFSKISLLRLWNNLCCYSISFLLAFLVTRNNSLTTVVVIAHFLYIRFMRRGMNFKFQPRNGIVRKSNFRSSVLSFCIFTLFFLFTLYIKLSSLRAILFEMMYNIGCAPRFAISSENEQLLENLSSTLRNGWSTLRVRLFITERTSKQNAQDIS